MKRFCDERRIMERPTIRQEEEKEDHDTEEVI